MYRSDLYPIYQKGVVSWKELLDLGRAASDRNLDDRLANIAINQVFPLQFCFGNILMYLEYNHYPDI